MKTFSKMFIGCLLSSNILLMWPFAVYAEQTVEETIKFISQTYEGCSKHKGETITFNGDVMIIKDIRKNTTTIYTYKISSLRPTVSHTRTRVTLQCSAPYCISRTKYGKKSGKSKTKLYNKRSISVCNRGEAARMERAFIHLIKKLGGTESPF